MSTSETVDMKHLLYIACGIHNPDYQNDPAFSSSYEYIKNMSVGPRMNTELHKAFILGLYPELKEPVEEFGKRAKIISMKNLDDKSTAEELDNAGDLIISKYNLPQAVHKSSSDEIKRNPNVQKNMQEALLKEVQEQMSPVVAELASRYAGKIHNYEELGKATEGFKFASLILGGRIDEKTACSCLDEDGAALGLDLLQLKKEGVITEKEIVDMNKFNQSKAVKNPAINGKSVDLSPTSIKTANQRY